MVLNEVVLPVMTISLWSSYVTSDTKGVKGNLPVPSVRVRSDVAGEL